MKKKFFVPAAIATLMGVGAYFGHATATPDDESDFLLANAEALAQDNETDDSMTCVTEVTYTGGFTIALYCTECTFLWGYAEAGSYSRCKQKNY